MDIRTNEIKVARAIRRLDSIEVWHECFDVLEEPLTELLAAYGIYATFTEAEGLLMRSHLYRLAERAEVAEAVHWANLNTDPLLPAIKDRMPVKPLHQSRDKAKAARVTKTLASFEAEELFATLNCEVI
jgi:hypothetical protein